MKCVINRKDVRLPQQLQRAMAAEAEAAREARAKVPFAFYFNKVSFLLLYHLNGAVFTICKLDLH